MKQKDYQQTLKGLSKLMSYILRHRPDEFGLCLDEEGFVSLKELHQAITEDKNWSFVRKSHLMDVINFADRERFELKDGKIRATYGHSIPVKLNYKPVTPPKLLYHATSRKAYPYILKKGLLPMGRQYAHLAVNKDLALRIGKRRDNKPVLLEIQAQKAAQDGIEFFCPNELIYLVKTIPPQYISGPPLHKVQKQPVQKKLPPPPPQITPGSFNLTPDMLGPFFDEKMDRSKRYSRKKAKKKKR
ncbi:MAG: RNA 2'-phosphotransferase [Candidatus Desulfofervidaceae bacterium]|nr:RNA 2'-phosphotransferase [Candidatus Desulfofervidaceae bacterium]